MELEAKNTALVTGGSGGIGAGITKALMNYGYKVVIADLVKPQPGDLKNGQVEYFKTDISSDTDRKKLLEFCIHRLNRLDLLVNNAGISVKSRGDMLYGDEASFDQLIKVNLKGPYFLTQAISKWMIESTKTASDVYRPKIVNIASLTSYASAAYMAKYALSKSAVSMMTKLYADRLSEYGINVYEIRPGIIETKMTLPSREKYDRFIEQGGLPIPRWGLPEDVGKAVLAIAMDLLPYSTGEVINVDGGFHLRRL